RDKASVLPQIVGISEKAAALFESQKGKVLKKAISKYRPMATISKFEIAAHLPVVLVGECLPQTLLPYRAVQHTPERTNCPRQVRAAFLRASYVSVFQPSTSARVGMAGIAPCRLVVRLAALLAKARMASSFSGVRASRSSLQSLERAAPKKVSPAPLVSPTVQGTPETRPVRLPMR